MASFSQVAKPGMVTNRRHSGPIEVPLQCAATGVGAQSHNLASPPASCLPAACWVDKKVPSGRLLLMTIEWTDYPRVKSPELQHAFQVRECTFAEGQQVL